MSEKEENMSYVKGGSGQASKSGTIDGKSYTVKVIWTQYKDTSTLQSYLNYNYYLTTKSKWELDVDVQIYFGWEGAVQQIDADLFETSKESGEFESVFTDSLKIVHTQSKDIFSKYPKFYVYFSRAGKTKNFVELNTSNTLGSSSDAWSPIYKSLTEPILSLYNENLTNYFGKSISFKITNTDSNATKYRISNLNNDKYQDYSSNSYNYCTFSKSNISSSGVHQFYAEAIGGKKDSNYIYVTATSVPIIVNIEQAPTILPPTNLSGPLSITGGSTGFYTASNPNPISLSTYVTISANNNDSDTGSLTFYPTTADTYTITASCYHTASETSSTGNPQMNVVVSDPSWSLTCTPSSGYVESIDSCIVNDLSSGTPCWYVAAGTTKANAATAKNSVGYSSTITGSNWGVVYLGNVSTITKEKLKSWYSGLQSDLDMFYFYVGCYVTVPIDEYHNYYTKFKWNSACYTFGEFDLTVKGFDYSNNPESITESITGVPETYFQDQVLLTWINPVSSKLRGQSITSVSVQARSSEDAGWVNCETDKTVSITPGDTNTVKATYKTAGTTYFRIFVVSSGGKSDETRLEDVLTSVQFQTSSFNVNTKNNLHPFANNSTVLMFNWYDYMDYLFVKTTDTTPQADKEYYYYDTSDPKKEHWEMVKNISSFTPGVIYYELTKKGVCGEKVSLLLSIWPGDNPTKISQEYILKENDNNYISYTSAIPVGDMSQKDMLDYCVNKNTYYHNLSSAQETNELFINTVKQGDEKAVLNGRYCYNFTLTVSNAFGKSKTITSTTYNLQFGQPPTFADGSSVDTKIYPYLTKSQTAATLWENAKLPADLNRMVNPTETLVFKFPQATDPNDDLAYYRLYACRLDDWNSNTAEPNADSCVYEELGTYNIPDQVSNVDGIVYLAYTLASNYAYSKYCYFKITALDANYDESGAIYYLPDEKPYILRGRATAANLGISEVTLGYYEPTTDTTPQAGTQYFTYDAPSLRYLLFKGTSFVKGITYYTKTEGISGKLVINSSITNQEPDLGGNLFQNSTTKYSDFPNLDKLEEDYKDYTLVLKWSTTSDFTDDTTDSITFKREEETGTYYNGLITAHNDGIYTSGGVIDDKRFNGKKIYIRFELSIRYAIDDFDSDGKPIYRSELVSYSPTAIIYGNTPTISPRPNYIGINTNNFETHDVVVVSTASTDRNIVRFKGAKDYEVTLDIENGAIVGLAIDCGTWT